MPTKNRQKGRTGRNIGSHGTSIAVTDVESSLMQPEHPLATFKPDPSDIPPANGAQVFKFPLDDVSAGNFWTRCIINSWVPAPRASDKSNQAHGLDKDSIANIWLPMPLTLNTTYAQKYSESDNMLVNRGNTMGGEGGGLGGFGAMLLKQAAAVSAGAASELAEFTSSVANVNNSGKMAMGSISNQMMGLVYDGASLRSHTLNWRMTPKDREEQKAIEVICFAFKKFSSPVVKGALAGDVTVKSSGESHAKTVAEIKEAEKESGKTTNNTDLIDDVADSLKNIGRLGIPVTVNVEFWYGAEINKHLFQIKDSFIQSVAVNYTPTGTWNAYEDGAPIETQLTVELKENAIITAGDIQQRGGY